MKSHEIYGLILAGGESKRMGTNKATIDFHGLPQYEYLYQLLKKYCHQVFISIGKTNQVANLINPIRDVFEISGPINGIASAFHSFPNVAWLSVPVDMPAVNEEVIENLLNQRDKEKLATCFYDSDGAAPEPLLAIWEQMAGERLIDYVQRGQFSPREFLKQEMTKLVEPPRRNVHLNINTKEELLRWRSGNKNS